ncbi:selenocysteine-specific translation elongation factor [Pseudonocardia endophytica]|uniref:Selenocysteine-specific elongation factor n=1 Tax=Pseudonocardia endophytica TaxID=401976 RepID=A0A4R1HTT6_PSEEN|nr:selenocysteine-specific translation elongation factor [Pseudonocardia endophytica]TCK26087.1 selenocysteine-specific elongation factor [Pseudonocardia endophytica]
MHVVCTAGHVDHGKSTLVRTLTGMEPDRFAEERRRGMTIDLGFAWTTLPGGDTVAFVDVPGHERFVSTMLAGAGPVPAALFVVAADEGWMPQSAEHADALEAIGVSRGLLVVTRSDLLDPELAGEDARAELAARGWDWPAVAVSATTGSGIDALRSALEELVGGLPAPDAGADVRFWVDRAFTVRGSGTVVTGTLPAGTLRTGDELELDTGDGPLTVGVRALQALGEPVDEAHPVARVAVNLRGVPRDRVRRGDVLLSGRWLRAGEIDVRLGGLRGEPAATDLPTELTLHAGSVAVPVRVRPLGPDDGGLVRLRLARPLPLRIGDRAVLRDPGGRRVLAGVTVLDVAPPALRRRGAAARRADDLADATGTPDATAELTRRGAVRADDLRAMGIPQPDVDGLAARVPGGAGWLLDPDRAGAAARDLAAAVAAHDRTDPLDPGLPLAAARRAAGLPDSALVPVVLAASRDAGPRDLVVDGGRVRSATGGGLPDAVRAAMDALHAELTDTPFAAPDADRLAALGLGPRELASLERAGELLRITPGTSPEVVLLPDAEDRAVALLAELDEEFTLSAARQALATTRRVAVPLLERLARNGRTVRTASGGHRLRGV